MRTEIFATKTDLTPGIKVIESKKDLHYTICNMCIANQIDVFRSLLDVKDLGHNTSGQYVSGVQYLVVERKYKIKNRKIKQVKGKYKGKYLYDVGPLKNPHSIVFLPNGTFKDEFLIKGEIGTVMESKKSIELYNFFRKEIIKGFENIKGCYIGPEAMELARTGVRLITMHTEESPEYDLVVD